MSIIERDISSLVLLNGYFLMPRIQVTHGIFLVFAQMCRCTRPDGCSGIARGASSRITGNIIYESTLGKLGLRWDVVGVFQLIIDSFVNMPISNG